MNTILNKQLIETHNSILSSEFICFLLYCDSLEKVQTWLKSIREIHPKANHHCLAYRVGGESLQEFASDDGEPSGTAGLPMLNVLKRNELTNIATIVVRYFGGTKLGKKGLIDAYREAVELALTQTEIKPLEKRSRLSITFPYDISSDVQKLIHTFHLEIESESFTEQVTHIISCPFEIENLLLQRLDLIRFKGLSHSEPEAYFS